MRVYIEFSKLIDAIMWWDSVQQCFSSRDVIQPITIYHHKSWVSNTRSACHSCGHWNKSPSKSYSKVQAAWPTMFYQVFYSWFCVRKTDTNHPSELCQAAAAQNQAVKNKKLEQFATNLSPQCFFKDQRCFKSPPTTQPTEGDKNAQKATFDSPFWDVLPTPCNCDNVLPWCGWIIFKCIYTIHKAFLFHQLLQALCWKINSALNLTVSILLSITQTSSCFLVFILACKNKFLPPEKKRSGYKGS